MFIKVNNLLPRMVAKNGLIRQIEAARVCELWQKAIKEKFSDEVSKKSKAIYFRDKILVVAVLNPVYAQEFQLRQYEIVEEINKRIGKPIVKRVKFEM